MGALQNLDLLSVGIAIAGIGVLGFSVFFNNRKSVTNRSFLYFSLLTIIWSAANYLAYQVRIPEISFWLFRVVIAIAVWHSFFFFQMSYVFPREKVVFRGWYKFILIPVASITSVLNLTPLVFSKISLISSDGRIGKIENGPAIALFGTLIAFLVIGGIARFLLKTLKAPAEERRQFRFVSTGIFITFLLLMIFNFILPAFFDNPRFIPLGAVFIFPYVALTSYAIIRYHLLNIKVITTEILAFVLAVVTLYEVILSEGLLLIILRSGIFLLVFSFGILLIQSVRREVEQREQLEKLNQQQREFLGFAAHDLKNPIALIKQLATLIYDKTYTDTKQIEETTGKIKTTADRAVRLIESFLDLRSLESGQLKYEFEEKNIVEFVKNVAGDFKPLVEQKGLKFSFESQAKDIRIKIDTVKIRQVIQNLLDNALKYTNQGYVKVSVKEESATNGKQLLPHSNILENVGMNSVLITVEDSGLGMKKEILPTLFEQFRRDPGVERKIAGTGLGLYISKQFVLGHNGEIWAESDGEGRGSKFFVKLRKS